MKKTLFLSAWAVSALCSAQNAYTISGKAIGAAENDTVTITKIAEGKDVLLGKAPVQGGKFVFKGTAEGDGPIYLRAYPKGIQMGLSAKAFTDGEKIDVVLDTYDEDYLSKSLACGTPLNDKYRSYQSEYKNLLLPLKEARQIYLDTTASAAQRAAAKEKWTRTYVAFCNYQADFVIENIRNAAGRTELQSGDFLFMPLTILQRTLDAIPENLRQEPQLAEMIAYAATRQATEASRPFIDFSSLSPAGDTLRLSDFAGKGKYVLIDFWSSWCGPCRTAMPKLITLYAKYKDKGFEVVGVSLDTKKDDWTKAITQLGLPWPQMSDLKLWDSSGVKEYGIKGIPTTILIDPNGKIVERNPELKEKLEEIFGK